MSVPGLMISLNSSIVNIPSKVVSDTGAQALANQAGNAGGSLPTNYSGATSGVLSVDQKTKVSELAEKIVAATASGDKAAAAKLVQENKAFIDTPGVSAALTKQVQSGIEAKQGGDQSFMGKYGELMFLAARALIEGLNRRQSDGYWTQLGTALKGLATPAAKPVSIPGLSE
jgi:hypothetical protein